MTVGVSDRISKSALHSDELPCESQISLLRFGALAASMLLIANSPVLSREAGKTTVKTVFGLIEGAPGPSGMVYKGVPYAAPPVGELRWRSPAPLPAWSGVRKAVNFGPPCMQSPLRGMTAVSSISSEDCLYLNIWTPLAKANTKFPVMVWIHGGGFTNGSATSPTYSGEHFASKDVILVTINYRLGPFGYLAHPDLTAESPHGSSGNYGLEDQLAALKWVSRNATAFGGDPANITIFGQSAGGASVFALLTSPKAKGYFKRAIIQSGAVSGSFSALAKASAEQQGVEFASDQSLAQLRNAEAAVILQRHEAAIRSGKRFGPVMDDYLVTQNPMEALAEPQRPPVALLIGSNAREGLGVVSKDALPPAISDAFGTSANDALRLYGLADGGAGRSDPLLGSSAEQFSTDSTFRCGNVKAARLNAEHGVPTWQYQFEQFVSGKEGQGAAHSFEVPYVFGTLSNTGFSAADYGPADRQLSDAMISYWTNFAKRGDPNGSRLAKWPRYEPVKRKYLRLSSMLPAAARAASDLRGEICRLFEPSFNEKRKL